MQAVGAQTDFRALNALTYSPAGSSRSETPLHFGMLWQSWLFSEDNQTEQMPLLFCFTIFLHQPGLAKVSCTSENGSTCKRVQEGHLLCCWMNFGSSALLYQNQPDEYDGSTVGGQSPLGSVYSSACMLNKSCCHSH